MPRRKNYEIRVTIRQKDGKTYLRFRDPLTQAEQLRQVRGKYESEWLREAGAWENELKDESTRKRAEKAAAAAAITDPRWSDFRVHLALDYLPSLAPSSVQTIISSLDCIEKCMSPMPSNLSDLTSVTIARIQTKLRETGIADATVASYLRHLKAVLTWAKSVNMVIAVPEFPKPRRAARQQKIKPMKGRPVKDEEFALMVKKVMENPDNIVPPGAEEKYKRLIRGLWTGGLRLDEALLLYWDRLDKMRVDLDSGKYPMLRILNSTEKGGKDRTYPIAPEFAEFLQETPLKERTGLVFDLMVRKTTRATDREQVTLEYASKVITAIGKAAGVITHITPARSKKAAQTHYAGAQDLRRTFGTRWARRVRAPILQQMMRHADMSTTMSYYVDLDADDLASDIHAAYSEFEAKRNRGADGGVEVICPHCGKKIP